MRADGRALRDAARRRRYADGRSACRTVAEIHVLSIDAVLPADVLDGIRGMDGATGTANGLHGQSIRTVLPRRLVLFDRFLVPRLQTRFSTGACARSNLATGPLTATLPRRSVYFGRNRARPAASRAERTSVREHARRRDREGIGRKTPAFYRPLRLSISTSVVRFRPRSCAARFLFLPVRSSACTMRSFS